MTQQQMQLARWIADTMLADGITAEVFALDPGETTEVYMDVVGRKIEKIQTTYISNPLARQSFLETAIREV